MLRLANSLADVLTKHGVDRVSPLVIFTVLFFFFFWYSPPIPGFFCWGSFYVSLGSLTIFSVNDQKREYKTSNVTESYLA